MCIHHSGLNSRSYLPQVIPYEKVLGPKHPSTLGYMDNLAAVARLQGKYETAENMHRQALGLSERLPGPEHPDLLMCMSHLTGMIAN